MKKISLVVRTYNESKHLGSLLEMVKRQKLDDLEVEVVLVDSGSTDGTVGIAEAVGAKIVKIEKNQFTFGRSLNLGCQHAQGDVLVIVSGHCVPVDDQWLQRITAPVLEGRCDYAYGRQMGAMNRSSARSKSSPSTSPLARKTPLEGITATMPTQRFPGRPGSV
ncbi:MAG: glycosyltransferase family 2 protein [Fibrobacterota bacterium]|nr:MAG: glycosyltransferase family 2 protein [Fibrobacterota bacterium]